MSKEPAAVHASMSRTRGVQQWRPPCLLQDQQSLMASHQFLLSGEVCVMTPITTSDKSDEALVRLVRSCWSLKPFRYKSV